jgi:hypothetical protein
MTIRQRVFVSLLALLAVVLSSGIVMAQTGNRGRSNFDWIVARRLTVSTLGLDVDGGDVTIVEGLTVDGEIDANGDTTMTAATVGTFLTLDEADVITVTNGATLTPLGSFQPIASAGAVGFGAIAAPTAGNILIVENTVNQTITITDSATLRLGGNAVLAQYDTLVLVYDGATWIQLSKTDN